MEGFNIFLTANITLLLFFLFLYALYNKKVIFNKIYHREKKEERFMYWFGTGFYGVLSVLYVILLIERILRVV